MKEQILKLRKEGKTYDEIVKIVGCSKGTVSYYCGKGQKEKSKLRQNKRRRRHRDWIIDYKKNCKCSKCGESRWWVLDFHHVDPDKKEDSIHNLLRNSTKEKVKEEINKCIVLCANCHRDLHYQKQKEEKE